MSLAAPRPVRMVLHLLMVILVLYPASHLLRQTWAARQRRSQLDNQAPKRGI